MKLIVALTSLVAAALAADLRAYGQTNCGGGYGECGNIGSGTCCVVNAVASVAVVYTAPGSQLFGYHDGGCTTIAQQQGTGQYSFLCMSDNSGRGFSGIRWYPGIPKVKRDTCGPAASEQCTGSARPDRIVLGDGHLFNLNGTDEATKQAMLDFLEKGATKADLPEKFHALEHDEEGVAARLAEIKTRFQ